MIIWISDPTGRFQRRPYFLLEDLDRRCERVITRFTTSLYGFPAIPVPTGALIKLLIAAGLADDRVRSDPAAQSSGLVVVHEDSQLAYDGGNYRTRVRRALHNASDAPITRYLIRVAVDRHPNASQLSNALYRQSPLSMGELGLKAACEDEPMTWDVKHDRDTFKEIWLLFENQTAQFPLYPGETTTIEYCYAVAAD
ncbi:MAG: hypothetical protein ACLQBA_23590 [Candidatus Binataceae bacterium]